MASSEYQKQWRLKNKSKIKAYNRWYDKTHREVRNAGRKRWLLKHPEYKKLWQRKATDNHKNAWEVIIKGIFGEVKCSSCGYFKYREAIDFHHIHPETKEYAISDMFRWKVTDERIEELKRCVILCCRCHREHHAKERIKMKGGI